MAATLYTTVDKLSTVLASYDQLEIHRAASKDGTYTLLTTLNLNNKDTLYKYEDSGGSSSHYYKTRYKNSTSGSTGDFSSPRKAKGIQQLKNNMELILILDSGIKNTDGDSLGEDKQFSFTTKYSPLYSSVKKVELHAGKFLGDVPEDTINLAIFESSLMADELTFNTASAKTSSLYKMARKEWVTCRAAEMLIINLMGNGGGMLSSKRLADFSVSYDNSFLERVLEDLKLCQARWEAQLNAGGAATRKPKGVIRGIKDPDRPAVGRGLDSSGSVPAANIKKRYSGTRRFVKGYYRYPRWYKK